MESKGDALRRISFFYKPKGMPPGDYAPGGKQQAVEKVFSTAWGSYLAWGGIFQAVWSVWSSWCARWERGFSRYSA